MGYLLAIGLSSNQHRGTTKARLSGRASRIPDGSDHQLKEAGSEDGRKCRFSAGLTRFVLPIDVIRKLGVDRPLSHLFYLGILAIGCLRESEGVSLQADELSRRIRRDSFALQKYPRGRERFVYDREGQHLIVKNVASGLGCWVIGGVAFAASFLPRQRLR